MAQAKAKRHRRKAAAGSAPHDAALTVGVVGAGVGVNHITAYRELGELYSVEALCDIDAERAQQGRGRARHRRRSSPISTRCSASSSTSSTSARPPRCISRRRGKALLAGHHVVVEKPFASSLAEADALAELERQSGKRVSPIFQYRFSNGIAQLLHLRRKGFVGKAYAATVETHWRRPAGLLRQSMARALGDGARRLLHHARDPQP